MKLVFWFILNYTSQTATACANDPIFIWRFRNKLGETYPLYPESTIACMIGYSDFLIFIQLIPPGLPAYDMNQNNGDLFEYSNEVSFIYLHMIDIEKQFKVFRYLFAYRAPTPQAEFIAINSLCDPTRLLRSSIWNDLSSFSAIGIYRFHPAWQFSVQSHRPCPLDFQKKQNEIW